MKRVLHYLRATTDLGLQLFRSTTSQLIAYSDADWAGCPATRRSTSGYCVFLGDNLLTWSFKRQDTLSRSSTEAEYHGVANPIAETSWIRNLLRELHTLLFTATLVYCDNVSAVYMSANPVQHQRTKHVGDASVTWSTAVLSPVSIYLSLFFKMANKHSIMTREMVESFCNSYYIPDEVHPTTPGRDIWVCLTYLFLGLSDPRKVQVVEVQKGEEQVKLLDRIKHCFVSLDAPTVVQQEGCSGSGVGPDVSAPSAKENVVAEENVIPAGTYLDLMDPEGDLTEAEKGDASEATDKVKRKKLSKQSDTLPAKKLRVDHPSLASGTGGKSLASLRRTIPEGSLTLGPSSQAVVHAKVTVQGSHVADAPVYTVAAAVTSSRGKMHVASMSDMGGSSQLETSEGEASGVLLKEKDVEIARLKSLVKEKETESAEVSRLRDQVSVLTAEIFILSAEVSHACDEARNLISSLSSERDGLASEKMEAQQEAQAQVLYNRVAELEAHVMDVSGRLEGEFYPAYLTALAGRRWLLTHGMELVMVKCLKSPEYQGILGHALGRAVDYGMQEGLAAEHEHRVAGTPLSAVMAYNPEAAKAHYLDAVRALEEADFPLVQLLLKSCFKPCLEHLSVPIYHADIKTVVRETSLSFALLNVHTCAEGARKHAAPLCQLMVDIISHPLSSQNLIGEASASAATFFVEDLDTDEALGSVVCMPQFEDLRFEIFP
ncbi:ribonuclease H-like domain-containing protein [Tanacetum coccineum]